MTKGIHYFEHFCPRIPGNINQTQFTRLLEIAGMCHMPTSGFNAWVGEVGSQNQMRRFNALFGTKCRSLRFVKSKSNGIKSPLHWANRVAIYHTMTSNCKPVESSIETARAKPSQGCGNQELASYGCSLGARAARPTTIDRAVRDAQWDSTVPAIWTPPRTYCVFRRTLNLVIVPDFFHTYLPQEIEISVNMHARRTCKFNLVPIKFHMWRGKKSFYFHRLKLRVSIIICW